MAGSSTAEPGQPAFYFDLASPEAYLTAERVLHALPVVAEWQPVWLGGLRGTPEPPGFRSDVERRAAAASLQAFRWPDPYPADTRWAMLVATYAKQIGRTVAFAQAAFRQAFAGGRDLGERDNVLIAAAACEMHPVATTKAAGLRSIATRLDEATAAAAAAGVLGVPAIRVGDAVFHGDAGVEEAARALGALVP
jgi:2-hydroxychromene-2-carboxylate isomerase